MAEGAKPNVWHTKEGFMQPKTAAQLVQEAKQRVENLSAERVAAELEQGDALLIDLREPNEQAEHGMIPGAISAPRGMLEFWADPTSPYHRQEFDPQRRIILHCASGGRSALAADTLQQLGYSNVAHLAGGLKAWAEEGRPITKHEPEAQR
jgi:rhodanese-related sulfurtransferase